MTETLHRLGICSMAAKEYRTAVDAFDKQYQIEKSNSSGSSLMVNLFNLTEARRRAGDNVSNDDIRKIVLLFEKHVTTVGARGITTRINRLQAMHIPYALLGDLEVARQLLAQVADLEFSISPRERVFSVINYYDVQADQIMLQNKEMQEALKSGKLWDGTQLPSLGR